ncbi:MAG: sialidase family protein [Vicinamibacterales bacterium]
MRAYVPGLCLILGLAASLGLSACRGADAPQPTPGGAPTAIARPPAFDVQSVPSPAGPGSLEPNVTVSERGLLVSWVERQDKLATLKFAERTADGWTATKTVASGDNWFVSHADVPTVLRMRDGTLVANWLVETDASIEAYNLMLSYSKDDGATWARPFTPHNDKTTTQHGFASFYELPGTFGLVWLDGRAQELDTTSPEGGAMSIRSATFNSAWTQTSDTAVDLRVCECCSTTVAVTSDGPITAFRDRSDKDVRDIAVSRLDGKAWTAGQIVHNDGWAIPACPVNGPMLSARDRSAAISWFTVKDEQGHAFAAFSPDAGRSWGAPIQLDESAALGYVDVELLDDGAALASWVEARPQQAPEVRLRRIDASGARGAFVTIGGSNGARPTGSPRFARFGDQVLLAWTESAPPAGGAPEGVLYVKTAATRVPRVTAIQ